jgi:hypothetical protein
LNDAIYARTTVIPASMSLKITIGASVATSMANGMIKTNIHFSAERVAFEHKEFWQVEHAFRDIKSSFDTRPAFSQRDEAIRGHDFYSLLVPVWRKDLCRRLDAAGHAFECSDIEQDLEALQETTIEDNGKRLAIRNQCLATCGKVFQAVRVTIRPPSANANLCRMTQPR